MNRAPYSHLASRMRLSARAAHNETPRSEFDTSYGFAAGVTSLCVGEAGRSVIAGLKDGRIAHVDSAARSPVLLQVPGCEEAPPCNPIVVALHEAALFAGDAKGNVTLWNTATFQCSGVLGCHDGGVASLLAVSAERLVSLSHPQNAQRSLVAWDTTRRKRIWSIALPGSDAGGDGMRHMCAIRFDGAEAAAVYVGDRILLVNVEQGVVVAEFVIPRRSGGHLSRVAFMSARDLAIDLVFEDCEIATISLASGLITTIASPGFLGDWDFVTSATAIHDQFIVICSDGTIGAWRRPGGELLWRRRDEAPWDEVVVDGGLVVTARGERMRVRPFAVLPPHARYTTPPHRARVSFAAAVANGGLLTISEEVAILWRDGVPVHKFATALPGAPEGNTLEGAPRLAHALSDDRTKLLTVCNWSLGELRLWDLDSGQMLLDSNVYRHLDPTSPLLERLGDLSESHPWVHDVAFLPGAPLQAVFGHINGKAMVVDLAPPVKRTCLLHLRTGMCDKVYEVLPIDRSRVAFHMQDAWEVWHLDPPLLQSRMQPSGSPLESIAPDDAGSFVRLASGSIVPRSIHDLLRAGSEGSDQGSCDSGASSDVVVSVESQSRVVCRDTCDPTTVRAEWVGDPDLVAAAVNAKGDVVVGHESGRVSHLSLERVFSVPRTMTCDAIGRAADLIASATAIFIGAGAGMGVDSGLPDFRGKEGFWNAYPPYRTLGLTFSQLATPRLFDSDPRVAWGFYAHRLALYSAQTPHAGFGILLQWTRRMKSGHFVYTTNVDGQFQKAGFSDRNILEAHGSVHVLQCTKACGYGRYRSPVSLTVDASMEAVGDLPICPNCGSMARPNVLMFDDTAFNEGSALEQFQNFQKWLDQLKDENLAVLQIGVGSGSALVRTQASMLSEFFKQPVICINPDGVGEGRDTVTIPFGALEALTQIDRQIRGGAGNPTTFR